MFCSSALFGGGISYLGYASNDYFFVIPTVCHGHPVQILLLSISLEQAQIRLFVKVFCGERGIRTPETLLEFTRFPGVPLQPLEHLSFVAIGLQEETRSASLACRHCSS